MFQFTYACRNKWKSQPPLHHFIKIDMRFQTFMKKKTIHLKIDIGKSFQIFTWKLTSDISMSAKSPT